MSPYEFGDLDLLEGPGPVFVPWHSPLKASMLGVSKKMGCFQDGQLQGR